MTFPVRPFLALAVLALGSGCVGPTTPLGAVDESLTGPRIQRTLEPAPAPPQPAPPGPAIEFSPPWQQVHGPYRWQVMVRDPAADPAPDPERVRVFYNGLEVSAATRFQFEDALVPDPAGGESRLLQLRLPDLRLGALEDHAIRVEYTSASGAVLSADYAPPFLSDWEAQEGIVDPGPFRISPEVLEVLRAAGRAYDTNPALLAALIAQESSFNPNALSRASALGLTQITHLTEREIARRFDHWPRYPGIHQLSRRRLRRLIPEVINCDNEWRLDTEKSVWGGAYYLSYLRTRLLHESNRAIVERGGPDLERVVAEAALAAYNSGLNRTLYRIKVGGEDWLEHRRMREAKRYVRKVMSYYGMFRDGVGAGKETG